MHNFYDVCMSIKINDQKISYRLWSTHLTCTESTLSMKMYDIYVTASTSRDMKGFAWFCCCWAGRCRDCFFMGLWVWIQCPCSQRKLEYKALEKSQRIIEYHPSMFPRTSPLSKTQLVSTDPHWSHFPGKISRNSWWVDSGWMVGTHPATLLFPLLNWRGRENITKGPQAKIRTVRDCSPITAMGKRDSTWEKLVYY